MQALTEPFEPGSTLKPFFAAALLATERATPDELIDTENGVYTIEGRTITDVHAERSMTLSEVIRHSSNIGIVKFASRLAPREQYEVLRDLGFGTPTGVRFPPRPGAHSGRLTSGRASRPRRWPWATRSPSRPCSWRSRMRRSRTAASCSSRPSFGRSAMRHGNVRFRHQPRFVRRVMTREVAATVRGMLVGAVEDGTAGRAGLGSFSVAGKTGTARVARGGRYVPSEYTASFVGFFPADDPQYVVLVKIDRPTGAYYGGQTAAPGDASGARGGDRRARRRSRPTGARLEGVARGAWRRRARTRPT